MIAIVAYKYPTFFNLGLTSLVPRFQESCHPCDHYTRGLKAHAAGAGLVSACGEIGICLRTLKRWRKACLGDDGGHNRRNGSHRLVSHWLSEEERQRILLTCNQPEYASLPRGQNVPDLANQGLFIG